jgi:CHASE2 domain-containing sensor protein
VNHAANARVSGIFDSGVSILATPLSTWWTRFARHFAINVAIGLVLMFVLELPFVQKNSAVATLQDSLINWQMDKLKGLDGSQNIAWINVDTQTYRDWGEPLITRRDKLALLLDFAMKHEPRAVIVDIDFSTPSRYDGALVHVLQKYGQCVGGCGPPIVLVRAFDDGVDNEYPDQAGPVNVARQSFLDQALGTAPERPWNGAGHVQWGAVTTDHDPDHMVRRWRLWENSCTAQGEAILTPSVAVLAVGEQRKSLAEIRDALQRHLSACVRKSSESLPQPNRSIQNELTGIGNPPHSITLTERGLQRRIVYRIPWETVNEANPAALGAVLHADTITHDASVDGSVLQDRIVVIGSSWDSLDMHPTPIGEMPGTLVLINEINSLEQGSVLTEPSVPAHYAIEIGLILFVSVVFALVAPAYALIVVVATIVIGTLTLGFIAFDAGVWVDSVIPLTGVLLHEVISRWREKVTHLIVRSEK